MMKRKTANVVKFVEDLHSFVVSNPQFRKNTRTKKETEIQAELRPLIVDFLVQYYKNLGYKDAVGKANKSFYWEGQEGRYGKKRRMTFAARNYPDFIITSPYLVAI